MSLHEGAHKRGIIHVLELRRQGLQPNPIRVVRPVRKSPH